MFHRHYDLLRADVYHNPQPPVLVSRFMLNLRQVNHARSDQSTFDDPDAGATLSFRKPISAASNMGEPLEFGQVDGLFHSDNTLDGGAKHPEGVAIELAEYPEAPMDEGNAGVDEVSCVETVMRWPSC